ncbi:hypothetical protein HN992_03350 [Candidatus Woesearchaeota archaeon]|jgi:hypothetical protein|nr:hypothetical protein [Candidatus Woesearchaeota archaeon]MBT3438909.1 hypothetical protein [Candidatus Woesearchaeota archaeon]MBT4058205.1 hypothetical protein [Candidatus Woesearchaeota archaeon]MBT4206830.1 hypothetical protein [Candidatus Woesearchaeota archaeon]MBT4731004.1 hypothetical protein [Candidatus Woesearchaeota archaeon]
MVQQMDAGLVPDRVQRPCRLCMAEQAHYRMGEVEADELGLLSAEFQCMGCMEIVPVAVGREEFRHEEIYIRSINNSKIITSF